MALWRLRVYGLIVLFTALGNAFSPETFADSMVREYNFYRNLHGVASVKLNHSMSADCDRYARALGSRSRVQPCLVHSRKNGENLMFYWNYASISEVELAEVTAKQFYDELKFYNFDKPGFRFSAAHFTQMIWKGVKEIGVGVFERAFVKCVYDPCSRKSPLFRDSFGDCRVGTLAPAKAYFVVIHHSPEGNRFDGDEFLNNVFSAKRRL
ncbi:hypothetical protein L596_003593 [Steinernema carpocapsae]|uniref:SCP domain-containing protein n=1 Tax=Steinernema carpocapsae TaxID=34508 RepID=A0A4U8UW96_STECR|nr:hypothetical protein L596_003593 [Steinernema carpocapsae]